MDAWDRELLLALNALVGRHPGFDRFVVQIAFNDLLKGAVTMAFVAWAWMGARGDSARLSRRRILSLGTLLLPALALNRGLASLLPFRQRPLYVEELAFRIPNGLKGRPFSDLSAFPSDHALMFCAFTFIVILSRPRLGFFMLLHTGIVVLLPRLYLGLHWPSDLLAGAGIAIVTVIASERAARSWRWMTWLQERGEALPGPAAAILLLISFGYATLFDPLVRLARYFAN